MNSIKLFQSKHKSHSSNPINNQDGEKVDSKTEGHLSSNKNTKILKARTKKFQLKWLSYDSKNEKKKLKSSVWGGYNSLSIVQGQTSMGEMKSQARNLFFDNKEDPDGSNEYDCQGYTRLCEPKAENVPEEEDLWRFVESLNF